MGTLHDAIVTSSPRLRTSDDWKVSYEKCFRATCNIIVGGMPRDLTTLLVSFVRGKVSLEGEHVRLVLTPRDSKELTRELVSQVSSSLRKIGCRCVLDETARD